MARARKLNREEASSLTNYILRKEGLGVSGNDQVNHILNMAKVKDGKVVLRSSCKRCVEVNSPHIEGFELK